MKIEIVKFKNGKYAVKRTSYFNCSEYKDLLESGWWGIEYSSKYCQGTLDEIKKIYFDITDYGTTIKLIEGKNENI